jgi:CarboxypepD_reg-like domain
MAVHDPASRLASLVRLLFLLIISLGYGCLLSAQVQISGRVLNDDTGEPLLNASVYINNTTIGTVTNAGGDYVLKGIPPGQYELIVSHVGFDLLVHRVSVGSSSLRITFRQVPKAKELRDILIVSSSQRKKWLEIMRVNFLGQTSAADKCRILNEDDIFFERTDRKEAIKAYSELPLVIENKELGYRIYFELQEFYFNAAEGQTRFYGYSRYEEMKESPDGPARKYARSRSRNYKGSTLHFFHALLRDALEQNGFSIFIRLNVAGNDSGHRVSVSAGSGSPGQPTSRQGESPAPAIAARARDILFYDSTKAMQYLQWNGILTVRFKEDPYYKASLQKKIFVVGSMPQGVQSNLRLLSSRAYIDENGILADPLALQYSGFWMYEKLANMMPIDYRPPN